MAGLVRDRSAGGYQRIPDPQGMSGETASQVYYRTGGPAYGEMPVPATHFVSAVTPLKSLEVVPDVLAGHDTAGTVERRDKMTGYTPTAGRQSYPTETPQMAKPVQSSKFQDWLVGPMVNFVQNRFLYRCGYPAATVMNGGKHNLALSTRVDQLATRSTGGPGPSQMTSAPRFKRVQTIPRYSTMPRAYKTESAPG